MSSLTPVSSPGSGSEGERPGGVRLQKVLAAAGYGSRRKCEELIDRGRVSIDGQVVVEQGKRVDPLVDVVRVDGQRITVPVGVEILVLNKPAGMLTAMSDDRGRPCVGDIVVGANRLFHVGRLDADTDGVLLLTNDGDLAHRLTHPSFGVEKTYVAEVKGIMGAGDLRRIREGVVLDGRAVEVSSARIRDSNSGRTIAEVVIHEGRNRVVRRLFDEIGFPVNSLTRTKFGPISLQSLRPGQVRELEATESIELYVAVDSAQARQRDSE